MKDWIEEIRQRADRATPGPWEHKKFEVGIRFNDSWTGFRTREEDAEFIANSRTDIPRLIRELERMERHLGNAYRMCRELMQPEAFEAFRDFQEKIE